MTNPYIFDLLFLAVLLFMYEYGKRRGAFRVAAGLLGTVGAWIGALALRPQVQPLVERLLTPYAVRAVTSAADSVGLTPVLEATVELSGTAGALAQSAATLGDQLAALGLPGQMAGLAEQLGITNSLSGTLSAAAALGEISPIQLLAESLVGRIAPTLTFFLLFLLIKLAIWLCVRVLSLDWPIIGALNRMAGGAIGLLGGAVLVLALCTGVFLFGSPEPAGLTSRMLLSQSLTGRLLAGLFGM